MTRAISFLRVWWHCLGRSEQHGHRLWADTRLNKSVRDGGEWTTSHFCQCGYLDRRTV